MKNLRMFLGTALAAGILTAAGGTANASGGAAETASLTSAAACSSYPGLGFIGGTVYAHKTGGCPDRPATVTALLVRDGVITARATCRAEAGRTCFAATPRVFAQPGVTYSAR